MSPGDRIPAGQDYYEARRDRNGGIGPGFWGPRGQEEGKNKQSRPEGEAHRSMKPIMRTLGAFGDVAGRPSYTVVYDSHS